MASEISSIDAATQILRSWQLVGLSPRPIDLLPLLRMNCLAELWSCEAPDAEWMDRFRVESFSLETQLRARARWRSSSLDDLLPYLADSFSDGMRPRTVVPYGMTDQWRRVLANSATGFDTPRSLLAEPIPELVDKIAMREWLRRLGVPLPVSLVVRGIDLDYRSLAKHLGSPFVAQTPAGSAGIGTCLIRDASDLAEAHARYPMVEWWLASEYAGDATLNFHGLVTTRGHIVVTRPSIQLANIASIGSGFGEYSGSDFLAPQAYAESVHLQCRSIVARIGNSLARLGHLGIFGVDFAVDGETVVVLEVNGRIQASTWLLGEIELRDNQVPTLCRHVLEALDCPTSGDVRPGPSAGVQLVIRHTGPAGHLVDPISAGVYAQKEDALVWRRSGIGLVDGDETELSLTNIPHPGTLVHNGAMVCRVVTSRSMTSPNGQALTETGNSLVDAIRRLCHIRSSDDK